MSTALDSTSERPVHATIARAHVPWPTWTTPAVTLLVAYFMVSLVASDYWLDAILIPFLAPSLAVVGPNLLTDYAGQLSIGSAAFMAMGASAAHNFNLRVEGLSLPVSTVPAGLAVIAIGVVFGLPSLRLHGFYLAVSTLAVQFFVQQALTKYGWLGNNNASGVIDAPPIVVAGFTFDAPALRYVFALTVMTILTALVWRLMQTPTGRHFITVRDNEMAARVTGMPVLRTKLLVFVISSFVIDVTGVLWGFVYLRTVEPAGFNLDRSFQILFIVIIDGLATIRDAFLGAALVVVSPLLLSRFGAFVFGDRFGSDVLNLSQRIVIGALIAAFLIAEPQGLAALWQRALRRISSVVRVASRH